MSDQPSHPTVYETDTPESLSAEFISEMYGAALAPERYEALVDSWQKATDHAGTLDAPLINADIARRHVDQTDKILEANAPFPVVEKLFATYNHLPAFLVSENRIIRLNNRASQLETTRHSTPSEADDEVTQPNGLPVAPANGVIARLLQTNESETILRRIPVVIEGKSGCDFIVLFDRRAMSSISESIAAAFSLTSAEQHVLTLTLQCLSRKEVAMQRGVSPETVKKQMERIFVKTGAQSQLELTLIGASMYRDASHNEYSVTDRSNQAPAPLCYFDDEKFLSDGDRTISYRTFGDENGVPILYFHGTYGFCCWPAAAELEAKRQGYKVIAPIRPGYGNTSESSPDQQVLDGIFNDICRILDHERAPSAYLVSLEYDSFLAFSFAAQFPDRVLGLFAFAGALPITQDAHFNRMPKWHRFVVGAARHTPALIPLVIRGGFHFAAKIGRREFVKHVYSNSAPDLAIMQDEEASKAILTGTRVALSTRHLAHRAFAQELQEFAKAEWAADVKACEGRMPVVFFNGVTAPIAPPETLEEFRTDYPWIKFKIYRDAGEFIFFSHWPQLFEALSESR